MKSVVDKNELAVPDLIFVRGACVLQEFESQADNRLGGLFSVEDAASQISEKLKKKGLLALFSSILTEFFLLVVSIRFSAFLCSLIIMNVFLLQKNSHFCRSSKSFIHNG